MRKISSMLLTSIVMLVALLFLVQPVESAPPKTQHMNPQSSLFLDDDTRLDCNNLEMFIYNDGNFAYDHANVLGKTDGLYYPRGTTKTVVYSAGIWVGAKVNGDTRLAIAEYNSEFGYGPMVNGSPLPDESRFRVYKVRDTDNDATNQDYANWPVDQGASVDVNGDPLILGNQMTWSVFNDAIPANHSNDAGSTEPLGIEIQHSAFGYSRSGPLGNVYFLKFKIINKGGNNLQDAYVSIWADPDLGNSSDDLVGCDTILGLGYCYNEGDDATYGANPPAVGFDFLQGPVVPGQPTDTAFVSGEARPGFRNLKMVSFNKYINGTDPAVSWETYGYMRGLVKDPSTGQMVPMINPITNQVTNYAVSGDPVNQTGWVDATAADRRLMLSTGPFNMAPGDTQEVMAAVLVGQGADPLSSITVLKVTDLQAQAAYDGNFDVPDQNKTIEVNARGRDHAVDVFWTSDMIGDIIYYPMLGEAYEFEGFNVFQGLAPNGQWKKIATYDINNDVALIYGDVLNPDIGAIERIVVQNGSNSGLQFHQFITTDAFTHQPLQNGETYYFAVSGYYYDVNHMTAFNDQSGNFLGYLTPTLESQKIIINAIPVSDPGILSDTALHVAGQSEGRVIIEWIDAAALTGHDYRVTFANDGTWGLQDLTLGQTLLDDQTNQSGDYNYPVVDGFMPRVSGPTPGISGWSWIGDRWISGVDAGLPHFFGGLGNGVDFFGSNVSASDYVPVEIRFSWTQTQKAYSYLRGGIPSYGFVGYFDVPFTVWDVSVTPNRQLNACFVEQNNGACQDQTWLPCDESGSSREYIFVFASTYSPTPSDFYTSKILTNDAMSMDILYSLWPRVRPGHNPATELSDGQMLVIDAAVPNGFGDIFEFSTGYECGDVNQSGEVGITDAIALINYLFAITLEPVDPADADVNCDGRIRITDCVYLINYIFLGGEAPCAACDFN